MRIPAGARTFAAYAASAAAGILGLVALTMVADKTGNAGLVKLRNYIVHN